MSEACRQLLIRADASAPIGTGHVMRCLALGQRWCRAGGQVTFAMAIAHVATRARLAREGFAVVDLPVEPGSSEDASATLLLARDLSAMWIVADGYVFADRWQNTIKAGARSLLVVDDYGHAKRYCADLILNSNISFDLRWYEQRKPSCRLALGSNFALLRREFIDWSGAARTIPATATKVLVTLGGSDPDNVTTRVLGGLRQIEDIEVVVVVGGGNSHRAVLESLVIDCNATTPWIRMVIDATNMPELMAWADVGITAGGSTLWELCFMGLPALMLVLAPNQEPAVRALHATGVAEWVPSPEAVAPALNALLPDAARRGRMSEAERHLVDGRGVDRVVKLMEAA